ncbi:MAG: glycosyltransferase [Bacteroidales bacterium]|nr:glycosyltransferase [Bacteroidales bacterium]
MSCPRLSVITITYNAAATLERTIESIERQTYQNIEYIIVDGASTDATMQIVARHSQIVAKAVSEPDNGLYDAMNKGLDLATGDYVWFVNAGDEIYKPETVAEMFAAAADADIYYGNTVMTDMDGHEIGDRRLKPPERLTWKSFRNGMLVSHQSFVARKAVCSHYDLKYRFSADFDWCINALKRSQSVCNTHLTLSRFLDGGITKHHIAAGLKERFGIMRKHYGLFTTILRHIPIGIKFFWFWATRGRF